MNDQVNNCTHGLKIICVFLEATCAGLEKIKTATQEENTANWKKTLLGQTTS